MKKNLFTVLCFFAFYIFSSHDMFLKLDGYFLEPNTPSVIQLYNGTFDNSENVIDRERMVDASLVGNGKRMPIETSQWYEKDSITFLNFKTGNTGTWVAGVSTAPRVIELKADDFNRYLKHDGVLDILEKRKANGTLGKDAVEKYSKHVKTIFQVGDKLSDDWNVELGYPIEFMPLENPYEIHTGHTLKVKLLRDGKPLANHLVYVGYNTRGIANHGHEHNHIDDHTHSHNAENDSPQHKHENASQPHEHHHDSEHKHTHNAKSSNHGHDHKHEGKHAHTHKDESHDHEHDTNHEHAQKEEKHGHNHEGISQLKTNADGIVNVAIDKQGVWYLRTIHMTEPNDKALTHESNWATLTFAIGSGLGHTHEQDHEEHVHEGEEFPTYLFLIVSAIVIAILFFWFNRKK